MIKCMATRVVTLPQSCDMLAYVDCAVLVVVVRSVCTCGLVWRGRMA